MSTSSPLTPRPRHRTPVVPLPRSTWRLFRRTITVGLFTVATVAGIGIGLQGAVVSPVAPVAQVAAAAAAAVPVVRPGHDRGPHR